MRRLFKKRKNLIVAGAIAAFFIFLYLSPDVLFEKAEISPADIEQKKGDDYTNEEIQSLIEQYMYDHVQDYSHGGGGGTSNTYNSYYTYDFDNVVTIAKGGYCDYNSIQDALNATPTEKTAFLVFPGTYTDTIHFTANQQTVVGVSHPTNTIVTQSDANIVNVSDYSSCTVKFLNIRLTDPDSDVDMITVGDGHLGVVDCKLYLNCSTTITGADQPHIANIYGDGFYKQKRGEFEYFHSGATTNGIKAPYDVTGENGTILLLRPCLCNITCNGSALATTLSVTDTTGTFEIMSLVEGFMYDPDATLVVGLGYIGIGAGNAEIYGNHIDIHGGASNSVYGVYHAGTGTMKSSHNRFHCTDNGGSAYAFFVGAGSTLVSHFDDVIAIDGYQNSGSLQMVSSFADGNLTISGNVTVGDLILPTTVPTHPVAGSVWFNATTGDLGIYNGTGWKWK